MYDDEATADALLFSAYRSAMQEARSKSAETVGFSLLSAGIFRGPKSLRDVLAIGVLAIEANVYCGLEEVFLVAFTPEEACSFAHRPYPTDLSYNTHLGYTYFSSARHAATTFFDPTRSGERSSCA